MRVVEYPLLLWGPGTSHSFPIQEWTYLAVCLRPKNKSAPADVPLPGRSLAVYESAINIKVAPGAADLPKEAKGIAYEETKRKRLRRRGASSKRARSGAVSILAATPTENRNKESPCRQKDICPLREFDSDPYLPFLIHFRTNV